MGLDSGISHRPLGWVINRSLRRVPVFKTNLISTFSLIAVSMANFTEHTIKLPDGIELLYTDSGAPNTASYTTLIVLHGSAFNGGTLDTHQASN
jgi:acetyl esterase/lipase